MKSIIVFVLLWLSFTISAQNVGIGTPTPDPSAMLDMVSTNQGVLIPRVVLTSAISAPATGLLVYQTSAPSGFYYFNGITWILIQ